MTQISAPWGGTSLGDATLAPYSDSEWARIWRDLFKVVKGTEGRLLGTGTSPDPGLTVQQTGVASASVDVTAGSALIHGTWFNTDASVNLAIAANASGNPRIDTVVARKSWAAQTIRLAILQGTPGATPVPPSLTQTDGVTWETPLADVAVANGFVSITNANITPRGIPANAAEAIYLYDVLNNSGGALETGDLVIWDYTADRAVKTSSTADDAQLAGVWVNRTPAGGYGRVQVGGVGYVRTAAAVTVRGQRLTQSSTAKQAAVSGIGASVGYALQTSGGAGLVLAVIDVAPAVVQSTYVGAANPTTTSAAFADVDGTNVKITITPRSGRVRVKFTVNVWMATTASPTAVEFTIRSSSLGTIGGDATHGIASQPSNNAFDVMCNMSVEWVFSGLTPGSAQTFTLQWRSTTAGKAVQIFNNTHPITMRAEDIG